MSDYPKFPTLYTVGQLQDMSPEERQKVSTEAAEWVEDLKERMRQARIKRSTSIIIDFFHTAHRLRSDCQKDRELEHQTGFTRQEREDHSS